MEGARLHDAHAGSGEVIPLNPHDNDILPDVTRQHLVVHGSDVALSLGYSLLGRWG